MKINDFKFLEIVSEIDKEIFQDSYINGKPDTEGDLIEHKFDNIFFIFNILIDIHAGKIINKKFHGKEIKIFYTLKDKGDYCLIRNKPKIEIWKYKGNYVPSILDIKGNGFGDAISLDINKKGYIKDWNVNNIDLSLFKEVTNNHEPFLFKAHEKANTLKLL